MVEFWDKTPLPLSTNAYKVISERSRGPSKILFQFCTTRSKVTVFLLWNAWLLDWFCLVHASWNWHPAFGPSFGISVAQTKTYELQDINNHQFLTHQFVLSHFWEMGFNIAKHLWTHPLAGCVSRQGRKIWALFVLSLTFYPLLPSPACLAKTRYSRLGTLESK